MEHIRPVLSQCGVTMELHGHTEQPITLALIRPAELDAYRAELAKSNPDYRYATLGQLAVMYANRIFQGIEVTQCSWTYDASIDTYERG
jgi:hypothetical protein